MMHHGIFMLTSQMAVMLSGPDLRNELRSWLSLNWDDLRRLKSVNTMDIFRLVYLHFEY